MKFKERHIGITETSKKEMLTAIGYNHIDELCKETLAENIDYKIKDFNEMSEQEFERHINSLGEKNTVSMSLIGQGFYPNYCPSIIRRNILENPCWYTQYTPYQAEISQGRLEALFNYQTLITELTGLPVANASLLDEGNACSEAIFMAYQANKTTKNKVFISNTIFKHNLHVIKTRFKYLDVDLVEGDLNDIDLSDNYFAIITQQFSNDGQANQYEDIFKKAKEHQITTICATDLLALTLFSPPGEMGADIVIGSAQRFGIPMGFGGPSAAFISCSEAFTRLLPGRIIGLSKDKHGNNGYRMALQTREQHIRREKPRQIFVQRKHYWLL